MARSSAFGLPNDSRGIYFSVISANPWGESNSMTTFRSGRKLNGEPLEKLDRRVPVPCSDHPWILQHLELG